MTTDPVVIASYARTPMGGFQGALTGATSPELGAAAVKAAVERAKVDPEAIERIYMGCVLPRRPRPSAGPPGSAGRGLAPVRRGDDDQQDVRLGDAGRDHGL